MAVVHSHAVHGWEAPSSTLVVACGHAQQAPSPHAASHPQAVLALYTGGRPSSISAPG
ncbi:hypothetical protein [Corallococcus sp. 4LFB]|uniref:hypothetical protein n=1 Tax=Corallococcus sp. 4LFB TaxID=3383249 RepID=UPI00397710FC